jgi:hypothetical protein
VYLGALIAAVRLMGAAPVSSGLRLAWNEASSMRMTVDSRRRTVVSTQ